MKNDPTLERVYAGGGFMARPLADGQPFKCFVCDEPARWAVMEWQGGEDGPPEHEETSVVEACPIHALVNVAIQLAPVSGDE